MAKSVYRSPNSILRKQGLFSSSERSNIVGMKHLVLAILLITAVLLFVYKDDFITDDSDDS